MYAKQNLPGNNILYSKLHVQDKTEKQNLYLQKPDD